MARPLLKPALLFGCLLLCTEISVLGAAHPAGPSTPGATGRTETSTPRAVHPADISIPGATGPADARALALVIDSPAFTWPIVVRRNDSGDIPVRIRVDITSLIGPSAQLADPLHLSMNGRDVAAAEFDLSSLDQKEVRLSGTLPLDGEFTGQLGIVIVAEGKRIPYDLKVTRRKPENQPKVRFVGATSDSKLAMTSDKSAFEWPLIIRRDDALKQDAEVTLDASVMSGPSGAIVEPKLLKDGKPLAGAIKLSSLGQESLTLTGTTDREGPYTGEISYNINGNSTSVMLNLTRTHPDLDFKIEPISKTYATSGDPVTLQLRLLNSTSTTREIYLPSIVQFERTDTLGSGPVQVATDDYKVAFKRDDGKPLQPLKADGDGALSLAATITGLTTNGSYKGVMRFTAPDRKPVDAAFELSLRLWCLWPALAIAAGVISAAALRYYQSTGQPRLLLQRNALVLRSNLTTLLQTESRDLKDREQRVFAHLIGQIDDASDKLADSATPIDTVSAIIGSIRRRSSLLTLWITCRRRQDTLPSPVAAVIEPDLDTATRTLMNDDATDANVETARAALDGIDAKITDALKRRFSDAATMLTDAIHEFALAEQPRFDVVATSVATVTEEANRSHFKEAEAALAQARSKFAEIAADLLRATLAAARPAFGFETDWAAFVAEITTMLDGVVHEVDPEKRVQRWTETNRRYLTKVVERANTRVEEKIEADMPGTKEALTRAHTKLSEAQAALTEGKLGVARTRYQEAIDAVGAARAVLRAQGDLMGKTAAADAEAPNSGAELPPSIIVEAIASVWPLPLGRDVTLAQVKREMRKYNIWFAVALLVIAVASGLQLLYIANPAFGYADLFVAFLWGAGTHAVAGQTFQGLAGLAQQLR